MAERLVQSLGFEAADAIATLGRLQKALTGVNSALLTFNQRTATPAAATKGLQQFQQQAQRTEKNLQTTASQFRKTGKAGKDAGDEITVSWETMARVIGTQITVRALNALIRGFGEAADAAHDFQLEIARTANIAQGPGGSFNELSESVRELAVTLGRDLSEVSEATFEGLQRDIGDVSETMDFLAGAAQNLSLVTGSDLTASMSSLSAVIKAQNLDISEATDVADIFFTAIDKGNVTLEEMNNRLGTVEPLANTLGIAFEESSAAVAALTLSGLNSRTAMTQLRNIFQKFVKPTKDLQAAFEELGVATGQEAVERFGGLQGALQALVGLVDGNEQALARMFGTIRGQLGIINLLNNSGSEFNRVLEAMGDRAGRAAEAASRIEELDARAADRSFAKLNNTFVEMGDNTQRLRTAAVDVFNFLIPNAQIAEGTILGIATSFTAAAIAARAAGISFAAALAPIAGTVAGVAGLSLLAARLGQEIGKIITLASEDFDRLEAERQEAIESTNRVAEESLKQQTELIDESTQQQLDLYKSLTDELTQEYNAQVKVASEALDNIRANAEDAVEAFEDAVKDIIKEIDSIIDGLDDRISDLGDSIANTRQEAEDFDFERALRGLEDLEVAEKRARRAADALRELGQTDVGLDPESQERFNDQLDKTNDLLDEALKAADRSGDPDAIRKAEELRRKGFQETIRAQENAQQRLADVQENLDKNRVAQLKRDLADLVEEAGKLGEDIELFDEEGKLIDPAKIREEFGEAGKALAEAVQNIDVDLVKALGIENLLVDSINDFLTRLNDVEVQWTGAINSLQTALDQHGAFRAAVEFGEPTGQPLVDEALQSQANVADPGKRIQEQIKALGELQKAQAAANVETQRLQEIIEANTSAVSGFINQALKQDLPAALSAGLTRLFEGAEAAAEQIRSTVAGGIGTNLQEIAQEISTAGEAQQAALNEQLNAVANSIAQAKANGDVSAAQAESLIQAVEAARQALDAQVQQAAQEELIDPQAVEAAKQRLQSLSEEAAAVELGLEAGARAASNTASTIGSEIPAAANKSSTAISGINAVLASIDASSAIAQMNALAAAARAALAAAQAAASASANAFHGRHFADGGSARGQDTIPAMLSPGEFVINARSSRAFAAELQAINSGQTPQFREEGGPVTNVGDINVNIQTDSARGIDARDIGQKIRREIRRGTLTL